MADPEIDILWRGEWIIREWMDTGCYHVQDEHRAVLGLLVGELERIRKMRVARWQARQRAKQVKQRKALADAQRGDRRVRDLLAKAAERDHGNGTS